MRTSPLALLVVVTLLLLALVACGEDAKPIAASATSGAASSRSPSKPSTAASAADAPAPAGIDVLGTVLDEVGESVVGREIAVVDARGRRSTALTDEGGTFFVRTVVPPYDLAIASTPSQRNAGPSAYLGLRAAEPRLVVVEHDGPPPRPPAQLVRVVVNVPTCHAPSCWITVVTSSPSGAGQVARTVDAKDRAAVLDVDHAWSSPAVSDGETIDVHVLTGDEGYSELAYGHVGGVAARAGTAAEVAVAPAHVAATAPITISAQGPVIPPDWEWTVATRMRLPGGAAVSLHYVAGPVLVTRLPRIDGATFEAGAWAQQPVRADDADARRSSFAWSGPSALTTSQVLLDLPSPIELVRPGPDGRVSRRAAGIAWSAASLGLVTLELDAASGHRVVHAYTTGGHLPFGRLAALGIARPDPGEYTLAVASYPDTTLEDVVARTQERAPATVGTSRAGTIAYQRMRFQIVP